MTNSTTFHGLDALVSDSLHHVLAFLPVRERFALLSTQKALLAREPLASRVTSYCGVCAACEAKTQYLCKRQHSHESRGFWAAVLRHSTPTGLSELRLAGCDAFDASVLKDAGARAALASLRVLELNRCSSVDAEALMLLAELCGNLRELHLRDMALDHAALRELLRRNRDTLRVVDLLGCHTVTGEDVRELAQCSQLQDLSLWGCHNVDNAALVHVVTRCATLERLNLRYAHKVDDKVVAAIATHLPRLKDLNLRYCYKVSDKGVLALCASLPGLRSLNLSQCTRITDAAMVRVAASLGRLRELRLWGCTKLTAAAVFSISSGLPELTLLDLRSRDKLETVIGGPTALKFLIQTYRSTLAKWEQAQGEELGVFKRPALCAAAA